MKLIITTLVPVEWAEQNEENLNVLNSVLHWCLVTSIVYQIWSLTGRVIKEWHCKNWQWFVVLFRGVHALGSIIKWFEPWSSSDKWTYIWRLHSCQHVRITLSGVNFINTNSSWKLITLELRIEFLLPIKHKTEDNCLDFMTHIWVLPCTAIPHTYSWSRVEFILVHSPSRARC